MTVTEPKILMRLDSSVLLSCSTALAQSTAQGETGFIKHAAQLRDGPGESSRSTVALQTSVVRLGGKQGAWTKVSAPDNSQGWVHMFDLTVATGTDACASSGNWAKVRVRVHCSGR